MFCPNCGNAINEGVVQCARCGWSEYPQRTRMEDEPGMRILLPVGRSLLSIVAGYVGLFAVLVFPAPIALVLGIVALVQIRKHPEKKLGGSGRAIFAIVMGSIFTLVPLVLILIALVNSR